MAFFSSKINALKSTFEKAKKVAETTYRSAVSRIGGSQSVSPSPPAPSQRQPFVVNYRKWDAALGDPDAILTFITEDMTNTILNEIGDSAVRSIQDALQPIEREGNLRDSFKSKVRGDTVEVFSTAPAAYVILSGQGWRRAPENAILEWMETKPESFGGLDDAEAMRVSFLIRRSLRKNRPPGQQSTLRKLKPTGQRKYDYVSVAMRDIEKDLSRFDIVLREIVT